jgi:hypothetical protein
MDSIKREIYMRAEALILGGETNFLCCALIYATREVIGLYVGTDDYDTLKKLFPEFFEGFSGVVWYERDGEVRHVDKISEQHSWWPRGGRPARLRYLRMVMAGQMTEAPLWHGLYALRGSRESFAE